MRIYEVTESTDLDYYRCDECATRLDAGLDKIIVIELNSIIITLCQKDAEDLLSGLNELEAGQPNDH